MIATIIGRFVSVPSEGESNIFLNPFSYLMLRKEKQLLHHFDSIMVDGQFLVSLVNLFLGKKLKRSSFDMTSLAPVTFLTAMERGKSVYLIGTDENSINCAVVRFKERYPLLHICGWRNGFFHSATERVESIVTICRLAPEIVVVGMGTPRQEKFLIDLKKSGWNGTGYTCGGFFHQTAKRIDYYPRWADKYHLRWVYRIIDEPKLLRRYSVDYSFFLVLFLLDLVRYKCKPYNADGARH
jgi:exopolysaccharide biosynthesis WecB/TagA/CpsF family protein